MLSPLFPAASVTTKTKVIRVFMDTVQNQLSVKLDPIDISKCVPVANVAAAEDVLMALAGPVEYQSHAVLSVSINRAANLVAARSRRGAGNVVLMHPTTFSNHVQYGPGFTAVTDNRVGRWTAKGKLVNSMVYVGDSLPENQIFVAYVRDLGHLAQPTVDSVGALISHNDQFMVYPIPADTSAMGSASDYIACLDIAA